MKRARESRSEREVLVRRGLAAARAGIYDENEIWIRHSGDKADIGDRLMGVIRNLFKALPLERKLTALSLGSGSEPQFKILEAAARGGLWLLDLDQRELAAVRERVRRQGIGRVRTIRADFDRLFLEAGSAEAFRKSALAGRRMDLITLHHSLYYCRADAWSAMYENLYRRILAPRGAIHAVLMASRSRDRSTTTWLYNRFAGKFFGVRNDQDLKAFARHLRANPVFRGAQVLSRTDRVDFRADDFGKFMAVVWMIMLYPEVHKYTPAQRREITEYVYDNFWAPGQPLVQAQDHLAVYRGLGFRGTA